MQINISKDKTDRWHNWFALEKKKKGGLGSKRNGYYTSDNPILQITQQSFRSDTS